VIGWSMQSRMEADLVMKALLMAVWRRQPKAEVIVHSDQGSQYTGYWQAQDLWSTDAVRVLGC